MKFEVPDVEIEQVRERGPKVLARGIKNTALNVKQRLHFKKVAGKEKGLAALSYLFLAGLIIRLWGKQPSEFLEYHERQSIILFVIFAFVLLIPEFGFTVFGPIVLFFMIVNLVVSALGGTLRLIPR